MKAKVCWTSCDSRQIYFYEVGAGAPVMLLHQSLLTGRVWLPIVSRLADAGFRVIVPDLAGHGASSPPKDVFGVPDLVADIWAVYNALGISEATLVGVSLGGLISLAAAAACPRRVSAN